MNKKTRRRLWFLTLVLLNMAANFVHSVTPTFFNELHLGQYMFGVALGSMMIVNFLFSPFWGKINDYISSRFSLLIGCTGYAIAQLFFYLSKTEPQIIAARMFAGVFTAGVYVSILTFIVNTEKDGRKRGSAIVAAATIQTIGAAFGYLIGGFLGEISVFMAFAAQIACLLASGILFFIVCENDSKISTKNIKVSEIIKQSNPFAAFLASREFMTVTLAVLFVVCVLQALGNLAFDQSFNYYIKDQLGFTPGYNGVLKGVMGIVALLVNSTITIYLIRKTNISKSVIGIFIISSIIMAAAVFITQPTVFVVSNVLFYAVSAMSLPMLQNMAAASGSEENSNLVMGFYNSMKSLGGIIGAMASGVLYAFGPKLPFIFGLISYIFACLFSAWYMKRKKRRQ